MARLIGVAVFMLIIAAVLAFIGISRPALLWDAPKIQNLIGRIGDAGARGVFLGLAGVNLVGAIFIFIKSRTAG